MKKLITIALACGLAAIASAATPTRVVLESSTNDATGNTTTTYIGAIRGTINDDGSVLIDAVPLIVVTDKLGGVIKRELSFTPVLIPLTAQQVAPLAALFAQTYATQKAEAAAAVERARLAKIAAEEAEAARLAAQAAAATP